MDKIVIINSLSKEVRYWGFQEYNFIFVGNKGLFGVFSAN
jgi:hypothetical protein